jgi:prophage tail gpP-like protein
MEKKNNLYDDSSHQNGESYELDESDEFDEESYQEFRKNLARSRKRDRAGKLRRMNKRDKRGI